MWDAPEGRPPPAISSRLFIIIYYELIKGIIKSKTRRGFGSSTSLTGALPFGKMLEKRGGDRKWRKKSEKSSR